MATSVLDLFEACGRAAGVEVEPVFDPPRLGELAAERPRSGAGGARARLASATSLEDGLAAPGSSFGLLEGEGASRGELDRPVDHRADLPATPPWRSAAFIAVSVATVELLILLVVGIWLFGKFFSDEARRRRDPTTVAQAVEREAQRATAARRCGAEADAGAKPVAKLARNETSVIILNGNGIQGAAARPRSRQSLRYLIAGTGNAARTDYPRSIVMYRPGFEREAQRLAKDVDIAPCRPLDGMRAGELQGAHVALVIGG